MTLLAEAQAGPTTADWMNNLSVLLQILILIGGAYAFVSGRRDKRTAVIEPNPLEVREATKHPTEAEAKLVHDEVKRRLDAHDAEIEQIWLEMRNEDKAIRALVQQELAKIERALGRIEGKLGTNTEAKL